MNFFKITNDEINSLNATEVNDQEHVDIIQLQSEITRLEKIAETLQTIAITNHADFNFTQLDTSIQNAKQDLDADKIEDASKSIDSANQLIVDAHQSLSEVAQQTTTNRAKDFTEKQIERFDKIDEHNATENVMTQISNVTVSKTNSNLTSIENPGEMIAKLRKLVSEGNVDEALKVIKSLDAYQKGTLANNENQTESQSQTSVDIQNNTETSSITPSQNPSNVTTTNPPITNTLNTTTASPIRMNSSHDQSPTPSQNPSNVTTTNPPITNTLNTTTASPIKTNSSNNENSSKPDKNRKTDKTNFFHNDVLNQQNNKTVSQVIPQGSFNPAQQDKTHEQKNHEKTPKPKNEKRNHE